MNEAPPRPLVSPPEDLHTPAPGEAARRNASRATAGASLWASARVAGLVLAVLAGSCESDPAPAPVTVGGHAFRFSTEGGRLDGARVHILEEPARTQITDDEGHWSFDGLEAGTPYTFVVAADGFRTTQTGTTAYEASTDDVTFQVPDDKLFAVLASLVDLTPSDERCQIASTVTRRGHSLYDGHGTHGEPDATVTIDPAGRADEGPVYFNLVSHNVIFPDKGLKQTSHDGGVLFLNVPPGDYTLSATKAGTSVRSVAVKCRPGVLVNPSPPWGLQVVSGGLEPKKPGEKGPFD